MKTQKKTQKNELLQEIMNYLQEMDYHYAKLQKMDYRYATALLDLFEASTSPSRYELFMGEELERKRRDIEKGEPLEVKLTNCGVIHEFRRAKNGLELLAKILISKGKHGGMREEAAALVLGELGAESRPILEQAASVTDDYIQRAVFYSWGKINQS